MKGLWLLITVLLFQAITVSGQLDPAKAGKQQFEFSGAFILKNQALKVWYYSPSTRPDTLPIVIMLHGAERNPSAYLDQWIPAADLFKLVVVAPEFDKAMFKGNEKYNMGNVWNEKENKFIPRDKWTFSVIEPLFDYIKTITGNSSQGYHLSGHSAGAQFVHRFLYFVPENRALSVMFANAGWYTMPNRFQVFPFGLGGSPVTDGDMKKTFARKVFVLLGEADTDTTSSNFQKGAPYSLQGGTRFERGQSFFEQARNESIRLGTPFNWTLFTVPGVGHANGEMAKRAAALFRMNMK